MNKEQAKFYAKKAVRRGKLFCAPWCGRGCTVAEHDRAVTSAEELLKKLNAIGGKWVARVWENLGWHYAAETPNERIKVSEHRDMLGDVQSYTIYANGHPHLGKQIVVDGKSLKSALKLVHESALAALDEAQQLVADTSKALGES